MDFRVLRTWPGVLLMLVFGIMLAICGADVLGVDLPEFIEPPGGERP